ncbi:MAG: diguanylate cyclase [Clostridiales bacterium]|jgi:diguanylate cyclase (GGDEF)-like protein|nr:diguanylate cyclase [Clostridiales bacterium]
MKKLLQKLDIKIVIICVAAVVLISASVFFALYFTTYNTVTSEIKERAGRAAGEFQTYLAENAEAFERISPASGTNGDYQSIRHEMYHIRGLADLEQLFAFKKDGDGYIYAVDASNPDASGFKTVGAEVEADYAEYLASAFGGDTVSADRINKNGLYTVFVPLKNADGDIIGAAALVFGAQNIRTAYVNIMIYGVISLALIAAVLGFAAYLVINKTADPFFKRLAYTDYLTGLGNRTAFEEDIKAINLDPSHPTEFIAAMFDLNNLKEINDKQGHSAGDRYLRLFAEMMDKSFSVNGSVYRIGGDEFTIIFRHADMKRAEADVAAMYKKFTEENPLFTFAVGLTLYSRSSDRSIQDAFGRADALMYEDKRRVKSGVKTDAG